MKKRYFVIAGILVAMCVGAVVLFARTSSDSNQDGLRAIRTIEKYVGNDVTESDNSSITANVVNYILPDNKGKYDYSFCAVEGLNRTDVRILFLYNNDGSVVEATDSKRSFVSKALVVDTAYMNDQYHNEFNYDKGTFAYKNGDQIGCFISEKAGYRCSSVWALDSSNRASVIWKDEDNS